MASILIRSNCRPAIPLMHAKRTLFNITDDIVRSEEKTDSHVVSAINYAILNSSNSLVDIDIATIRLHMYCIIGNFNAIKRFIISFTSTHGLMATRLLLNTNIKVANNVTHCPAFYMTPIFCALLWNSNPQIIRLLYSYGARPNSPDINNLFIEEKFFSIPYFNHINQNQNPNPNNSSIYWRDIKEFSMVAQEVRALSGEHIFDKSWVTPTMQM
tara:strand:- start:19 stop:660 length:642 start_codon:yes stop_codon:yes gene_type:complete